VDQNLLEGVQEILRKIPLQNSLLRDSQKLYVAVINIISRRMEVLASELSLLEYRRRMVSSILLQ
jgi:hypothetical protein